MVASSPPPATIIPGIACPKCRCDLCPIECTKLPCPGARIRYRVCSNCGCRIVTREHIVRWTYPLPKDAKLDAAKIRRVLKAKKSCR